MKENQLENTDLSKFQNILDKYQILLDQESDAFDERPVSKMFGIERGGPLVLVKKEFINNLRKRISENSNALNSLLENEESEAKIGYTNQVDFLDQENNEALNSNDPVILKSVKQRNFPEENKTQSKNILDWKLGVIEELKNLITN